MAAGGLVGRGTFPRRNEELFRERLARLEAEDVERGGKGNIDGHHVDGDQTNNVFENSEAVPQKGNMEAIGGLPPMGDQIDFPVGALIFSTENELIGKLNTRVWLSDSDAFWAPKEADDHLSGVQGAITEFVHAQAAQAASTGQSVIRFEDGMLGRLQSGDPPLILVNEDICMLAKGCERISATRAFFWTHVYVAPRVDPDRVDPFPGNVNAGVLLIRQLFAGGREGGRDTLWRKYAGVEAKAPFPPAEEPIQAAPENAASLRDGITLTEILKSSPQSDTVKVVAPCPCVRADLPSDAPGSGDTPTVETPAIGDEAPLKKPRLMSSPSPSHALPAESSSWETIVIELSPASSVDDDPRLPDCD